MESDYRQYVVNANQYPDGTRPVSPYQLGQEYAERFARIRGYTDFVNPVLLEREDFRRGFKESYKSFNALFTGHVTREELGEVSI